MKLDKEKVRQVADLAQLEIDEDEEEEFAHQLSDILEYAEKLKELDTAEVEPMAHVQPVNNVLRKDEVKESLSQEEVLANTAEKERGMFKVPQIVDSE